MIADKETSPRRRSPYQGLVPYDEEDAPFFFGREKETRLIIANLFASPLTLLYGASGVGKSSVLRAGVAHRLRSREDLLLILFSSWQGDSAAQLKSAIAKAVAGVGGPLPPIAADMPLASSLSHCATSLKRRILVILDQFEEYFLYNPVDDAFAAELPAAVMISDAPVSFLLSLRDDHFSRLDRFEGRIPTLFDTYFRVEHLDRESARTAIEKPLEEFNRRLPEGEPRYEVEPKLVECVLDEVKAGNLLLGEAGRGMLKEGTGRDQIETPYLQLVMTRIWEQEQANVSRCLRLDTLGTLGGARTIVRQHLDQAMSGLPSAEQDIAARVFHYLVTPSGTKIAHSLLDLVEYAKVSREALAATMERLSRGESRILRGVTSPLESEPRYEIFHDALGPAILDWRSRYVQRQQREEAEERLRQEREEAKRLAAEKERELRQAQAVAEAERRQVEAEFQRAQEHARSARVLRFVLFGLTLVLALAIWLGIRADRNEKLAIESAKLAAESEERATRSEKEALRLKNEAVKLKNDYSRQLATLEEVIAAKGDTELREALNVTQGTNQPRLTRQQEAVKEQTLDTASAASVVRTPARWKFWRTGATLRVRFLDGDPEVQSKVEKIAREWTKYANLRFIFGSSRDAEIRISFEDPGSWSFIGTDALVIPRRNQTLNLGWVTRDTPEQETRRVVLREFGHVLGLINEHQNPNARIPWNEHAVYSYYMGPPNNWTREQVAANLLQTYPKDVFGIEYREFDPKSIMMFPIDNALTVGDFEVGWNTDLSESDKEFVRRLYPPQ